MSFFHQDNHAQDILDRDSAHLLPVYARYPPAFLPSFLLQREHVDHAMELLCRLLKVAGAEEHAEQLAAVAV